MAEHHDTPVETWLSAGDTRAGFLPSVGFNCTALRVLRDGQWQSTLAEPPSWEEARACPSFYGSPLLGPYVYGARGDALRYRGKEYQLQPGGEGRAMHGLTRDHPWQVLDIQQTQNEATLTAQLVVGGEGDQEQARLHEWPFPMSIQVKYTLRSRSLLTEFTLQNTGTEPMPFGVGIHPYFRIPLAERSRLGNVTVTGRMTRLTDGPWGHINKRLGGYTASSPDLFVRLDEYLGRTMAGRPFLDLFERAAGESDTESTAGALWSLRDAGAGLGVEIDASSDFRYVGQFSPAHRRVLSPVVSTNRPGLFELEERGELGGLLELAPGGYWQGWCSLRIRDL